LRRHRIKKTKRHIRFRWAKELKILGGAGKGGQIRVRKSERWAPSTEYEHVRGGAAGRESRSGVPR
jgi:hypothetical protein